MRDKAVRVRMELKVSERRASKLAAVVRVASDMMKRAPLWEGCQLRVTGFPEDVVQVVKMAKRLMPSVALAKGIQVRESKNLRWATNTTD